MAVVQKKPYEEQAQQAQQAQPQQYTGLAGVSQQTAQKAQQYMNGYQQGQAVQQSQQQLQQIQSQKPQGYTSKYSGQLDSILQQIQNPQKFNYEFGQDPLFRSYADYYTQLGRQASLNAQGQAAALTGGYGNSYAQMAGQQANQQYLLGLYDKGMDLYDRAYQRNRDQVGDLKDQYGMLQQAEALDYGRFRDQVGDWQTDRDYYTQMYNTEANRDLNQYNADRDYYTGLAQIENADYRNEQERQEAIRQYEQDFAERQRQYNLSMEENRRQFDESLSWDKMSADQKYAAQYCMSILQNGQMPSDALLAAAGLSREDAQKMMAQLTTGGGGSGGKKSGGTYYTDPYGNAYEQTENKNGTVNYTAVKWEDVPDNATIDDTYGKNPQLFDTIRGGLTSAANAITSGQAGAAAGNAVNQAAGAIGNLWDKLLGKKSSGN